MDQEACTTEVVPIKSIIPLPTAAYQLIKRTIESSSYKVNADMNKEVDINTDHMLEKNKKPQDTSITSRLKAISFSEKATHQSMFKYFLSTIFEIYWK